MEHAGDGAMKRPARFAISSAAVDGAVALVGGAELHHMRDVMRLAPGAAVALFDERGAEYAGTLRGFQARHAVVEIAAPGRSRAQSTDGLILAAAVIKGPRMDFLVEKAAELGAAELWPVLTARGVVREVGGERLARWRRLATAAAKQSLAPRATEVIAPLGLEDLIRRADGGRLCVVLSAGAPPLGAILREARPRALLLLCGPEGDFTDEELAAARAAGFVAAGLGGRRLRSETAALAALSIAASALDELDGAVGGED
jgi:16S rRNA (uracil1498-N3)-methyltransferase